MSPRDSYHALPPSSGPSGPYNSLLSSSITSIASTASRPGAHSSSSHITKTYRQASTLFLTRRLPEALTTLLPLISPPEPVGNGEPAPVAKASRNTRVKVWSLYLTIMNAIIELEPEEGKDAFGGQEWRGLCSKVRDGEIWEEVVRNGYHGVEGDVDSDVVINLATILLAHARDQLVNQKRLEAYLANSQNPNLDFAGLGGSSQHGSRSSSRFRSPARGPSGASTPRDLNARVKILELYTLHVLLRNNEWDYAREFISMNAVLDEERREAFLQALQSLQDEQLEQERLEEEERQRQEDQLRREIEAAKRLRAENEEKERRRLEEERNRREGSEVDYGIESTPVTARTSTTNGRAAKPHSGSRLSPRPSTSKPARKPPGPLTLTARANMIYTQFRATIDQIANALNHNPVFAMRLLAFIMGLLIMLGNKGMRQRLQRLLGGSWNKIKATVGMGTKISYI